MTDFISSTQRFDAQINRSYPWRKLSQEDAKTFYCWLGKRLKKGMETDFSEYELGRRHALNCEKNYQDLEKLEMSWEVWQAQERERVIAETMKPEPAVSLANNFAPVPGGQSQNDHLARLQAAWIIGLKFRVRTQIAENPTWGLVCDEDGPKRA